MGKKAKVGKQRRDKYYQLAKETGYRSRAAFKLIQLNRKFSFLQKSRVLVDLCAAPGGWMQVAKQNMPVSSVVVGVDLFPIKPVPGCISIVEDITTEKCKQSLQRELKTWKADVFLHDGAPNVGMNWLHDAHQQALLTLSAAKLATQMLRKGGWFISKVFRSKDYNPLIWVLKQLFKKVHATKPQASRTESAEIFVVCQGYLAPDKLDSRFFEPKHVFEELELEPKSASSFFHPERQKKAKAEGYPENAASMYKALPASQLIASENPVDLLQVATEVKLDDEAISNHPRTTEEVKQCLKDIKVLGRKDLRMLMNWCEAVKASLAPPTPVPAEDASTKVKDGDDEEEEEEDIDKQLAELKESERKELKRKKKAKLKERRKLQERLNLKMVVKGDDGPTLTDGDDMFALRAVASEKVLKHLENQNIEEAVAEESESEEEEPETKKKVERYVPGATQLDSSGKYYKGGADSDASDKEEEEEPNHLYNTKLEHGLGLSDSELSFESGSEDEEDSADEDQDGERKHPLLTDLDHRTKTQKRVQRAQLWFEKDAFEGAQAEEDEDLELDALAAELRNKGGQLIGEKNGTTAASSEGMESEEDEVVDSGDDSGSDYEMPELPRNNKKRAADFDDFDDKKGAKAGFEVVPKDDGLKRMKLDANALALGSMIATSRRKRRDFEDAGWHRNAFNDENLPDWFVEDEKRHCFKEPPVPKELVDELKKKTQEINARPIKKVIEAKARKKKRAVRKLEKAKKKVEALMESKEVSEQEKARQIKQLYKKAAGGKKPEVKYVVAKKHTAAKRARRPPGVKGPYKVVDPRMKKDTRGMMRAQARSNNKGKSGKGSNKRGGKKPKPSGARRGANASKRAGAGGKKKGKGR